MFKTTWTQTYLLERKGEFKTTLMLTHDADTKVSVWFPSQQERRVEKKTNKLAFKEEKVRQEKQMLNLRMNIQGLKL